jgi:hypothetical protein
VGGGDIFNFRKEVSMRTIYKYQLKLQDDQVIEIPEGAEIISAREQRGEICIWAIVPVPTEVQMKITVHIRGTGHTMPEGTANTMFIDTVMLPEVNLVFHLFWSHVR